MTSNPGYSRGPAGGGNFRPQGGPAMASRPGGGSNRSSGGRHDFHGFVDFHQNFTAQRRFHASAYRRPSGWYSHHWVFGEFLPAAFWVRDYWLVDFVNFGLPPPPYGAVWVRVGDDALLIDQDSGEIITAEYGVFY
jgi:Ni/Co efflux regulator RcnB